jgi:hypothetical protein
LQLDALKEKEEEKGLAFPLQPFMWRKAGRLQANSLGPELALMTKRMVHLLYYSGTWEQASIMLS